MQNTQAIQETTKEAGCRSGITALMMLLCVAMNVQAGAQQPRAPEARTEAAVVVDDDGWSKAEETGDTAYVDQLLLPEYRSISVDGSIHDKAAILASTRKSSPERTAKINQWKAEHPEIPSVVISGDTAVLTFALDRGTPKPIMSCDIFVYRDGHWRAIYSQHTAAGG